MMKTLQRSTLLCLLLLALLLPAAIHAEEGGTEPALATPTVGFSLPAESFVALDAAFREGAFGGELKSVALSETMTFLFVPEEEDRFMPSLTIQDAQGAQLPTDATAMVEVVQSIIQTAQFLQGEFPDEFLFSTEKMQAHADATLGFAIADPEVWLWMDNGAAVMLPFYFHIDDNTMVDDPYLLTIAQMQDGSGQYLLYNGAEYVVDYLMCVEMVSDQSLFQQTMINWYMERFVDGQADVSLGTVEVKVESGKVRAEGHSEADEVGIVLKGQTFSILSISEGGWYEIELADGTRGFVSPLLVTKK